MGIEVAVVAAIVGAGAAVVGAGTAIYSADQQAAAGREAKRVAAVAADAEAKSTAEKVKVLAEENKRKESMARARAAASGVGGPSSEIYISALEKSGREDIDWLKEVGATKYQAAVASGESAYAQAQAGMWGSYGQAGGYLGKAADATTKI